MPAISTENRSLTLGIVLMLKGRSGIQEVGRLAEIVRPLRVRMHGAITRVYTLPLAAEMLGEDAELLWGGPGELRAQDLGAESLEAPRPKESPSGTWRRLAVIMHAMLRDGTLFEA
ncbi:hypothetical protein [Mesorhizobium sp. M0220]|uniref:hypothetical protein n=1 Tax=Mesorhizobium sp. M0220 TaxID=2956920 RepID=UPI00333CD288